MRKKTPGRDDSGKRSRMGKNGSSIFMREKYTEKTGNRNAVACVKNGSVVFAATASPLR